MPERQAIKGFMFGTTFGTMTHLAVRPGTSFPVQRSQVELARPQFLKWRRTAPFYSGWFL